MRIRKHAKISPLLYTASSLKPGTVIQTHVCQLNQSPWDVMSFSPPSTPPPPPPRPPPPPTQVLGNDCNGFAGFSSAETIPVLERNNRDYNNSTTTPAANKAAEQPEKPVTLCIKTDGKSWQCRREAAKGNSLCEHHLSLVKSYNSSGYSKKSGKPTARTRPRRATTTTSPSNPHEFYYYSGFGPRWGKKRSEARRDDMSGNKHAKYENDELSPFVLSRFDRDMYRSKDEDEDEDENEDEDEYEGEENRKKRPRRPIKERSLKSLM